MPLKGYKQTEVQKENIRKAHLGKPSGALGKSWEKPIKIELIECACGCKKILNKFDKKNRERRYIRGHNVPKGKENKFWNGGPKNNADLRRCTKYNEWRRNVFIKDNYTCQKCGKKSKKGARIKMNADHIKSFKDYPELRFEVSNGQVLCERPCHKEKTRKENIERNNLIKKTLKI